MVVISTNAVARPGRNQLSTIDQQANFGLGLACDNGNLDRTPPAARGWTQRANHVKIHRNGNLSNGGSYMTEAVIVESVRTPIGRHGGILKNVRPDDLAALVLAEVVKRAKVDSALVEEVYMGCANQAGEDNRNVARMATLLAGFPVSVGAVTFNRLCASGLAAINAAARAIKVGEGDVYVAGGVESMTRAPYAMAKTSPEWTFGNATMWDTTIGWRFPNPRMKEMYGMDAMGETAENVYELTRSISREEQDQFSLESHRRAVAAIESGKSAEEIVPVPIPQKKGEPLLVKPG